MSKSHSQRFVTLVDDAKTRIKEISPKKLKSKLDAEEEITIIDVREQDEWEKSHIAGASYLGKGIIERDIESKYPDPQQELILYCGGGFRSALAADNVQKMGYKNVKSLAGGFRSWTEAGLPISKSDE